MFLYFKFVVMRETELLVVVILPSSKIRVERECCLRETLRREIGLESGDIIEKSRECEEMKRGLEREEVGFLFVLEKKPMIVCVGILKHSILSLSQ